MQKMKKNINEIVAFTKGILQVLIIATIGYFLKSEAITIVMIIITIAIHIEIDRRNLTNKTSGFTWFITIILFILILFVAGWAN